MLNSGWYDSELKEYLAPNLVAEAAKVLGINDDRARLAIARAGMIDGKKIGQFNVCVEVVATGTGVDAGELRTLAESPEIEKRCRESTARFFDLKIDQRPGFLIESDIGDRAVFSGLIHDAPLFATIDAMIEDSMGYQTHQAHFGDPPG
jgi:predicted DsbA family dithiol-disulfide isomerase